MVAQPRLLDRFRDVLRRRHYSCKTEKNYIRWIKHFVTFHNMQSSREMGAAEVEAFLTHLANDFKVAPSKQNQAFSGLIYKSTQ